jgi:hypothetical protein
MVMDLGAVATPNNDSRRAYLSTPSEVKHRFTRNTNFSDTTDTF